MAGCCDVAHNGFSRRCSWLSWNSYTHILTFLFLSLLNFNQQIADFSFIQIVYRLLSYEKYYV